MRGFLALLVDEFLKLSAQVQASIVFPHYLLDVEFLHCRRGLVGQYAGGFS